MKNKKLKERIGKKVSGFALACFMEAVPNLITLWQEKSPDETFDSFLLKEYNFAKGVKENV